MEHTNASLYYYVVRLIVDRSCGLLAKIIGANYSEQRFRVIIRTYINVTRKHGPSPLLLRKENKTDKREGTMDELRDERPSDL